MAAKKQGLFDRIASYTAKIAGRSSTFAVALGALIVWFCSGPFFAWGETWQLVVNTATTIVTFLMVFLLQNSQSRDTMAMQIKLDEIIRATAMARGELADLEDLSEKEQRRIRDQVREEMRHSPDA